jgi:hypothetical protein
MGLQNNYGSSKGIQRKKKVGQGEIDIEYINCCHVP